MRQIRRILSVLALLVGLLIVGTTVATAQEVVNVGGTEVEIYTDWINFSIFVDEEANTVQIHNNLNTMDVFLTLLVETCQNVVGWIFDPQISQESDGQIIYDEFHPEPSGSTGVIDAGSGDQSLNVDFGNQNGQVTINWTFDCDDCEPDPEVCVETTPGTWSDWSDWKEEGDKLVRSRSRELLDINTGEVCGTETQDQEKKQQDPDEENPQRGGHFCTQIIGNDLGGDFASIEIINDFGQKETWLGRHGFGAIEDAGGGYWKIWIHLFAGGLDHGRMIVTGVNGVVVLFQVDKSGDACYIPAEQVDLNKKQFAPQIPEPGIGDQSDDGFTQIGYATISGQELPVYEGFVKDDQVQIARFGVTVYDEQYWIHRVQNFGWVRFSNGDEITISGTHYRLVEIERTNGYEYTTDQLPDNLIGTCFTNGEDWAGVELYKLVQVIPFHQATIQ